MTNELAPEILAERRALINAASQASSELHAAAVEVSDSMGLVSDRAYIETHKKAWLAAESALAAFYVRYPMSVYRKQFNAETKAYRGRA